MCMPPAETPAPRPVSKRRKPASGIALDVDPADLSLQPLGWKCWLRSIWLSGSVGLLASFLAHAVAMIILAWIVIAHPERSDPDPLVMSWLDPSKTPAKPKKQP